MGFETYLKVGGEVILVYRKYTSLLPRLLFRHDQVLVTDISGSVGDDESSEDENLQIKVVYQTTVDEVLANLEDAGLGWQAAVAAYSETRFNGGFDIAVALQVEAKEGVSFEEARRRSEEFRQRPPERDLTELGRFLAYRWGDPEVRELEIFDEITFDGNIESTFGTAWKLFDEASRVDGIDAYHAASAAMSWCVMYREAPLLAWPLLLCVFLYHLNRDLIVEYDISEAVTAETAGVVTVESGRAFANEYWRDASEGLSSSAASLGRLFSVLAALDSKLGRNFWFARAVDTYGRIGSLADATDALPMKRRGEALEELVAAVVRTEEPDLRLLQKNFRSKEEEIDLLVSNGLHDPFWVAQSSPLVLIECKNWKQKVGVPELRIFESKIKDRGALCRVGIFVSMSGFTQQFLERLKNFQSRDGVIFAVTGNDLQQLLAKKMRLSEWLARTGIVRSLGRSRSE